MSDTAVFTPYTALIRRDLLVALRHLGQTLQPLLFYVLIVILFPLAIGPEQQRLHMLGPGIIWVAALLSTLLALDNLFRHDAQDGSLELLLLSPHSLVGLVSAKVFSHWLLTGLPLVLLTPVLGLLFSLSLNSTGILLLSLLLGTPTLSLIGAIGAALTVTMRNSGVLLALTILPLTIPTLIFATSAVNAGMVGLPVQAPLYLLAAVFTLALSLGPFAIAAALKLTMQ